MKFTIYDQNGAASKEATLPKELFGQEDHQDLLYRFVVMQRANARSAIADTKSKGEVIATKKKPYVQKKTGRARQGAVNNPHYKGGGVAFGPSSERNFEKALPRGMRRRALTAALSSRVADGAYAGITGFDRISTKSFAALLAKVGVSRSALVIASASAGESLQKSARNIPFVKVLHPGYLNPVDVLGFEKVIFVGSALDEVTSTFSSAK